MIAKDAIRRALDTLGLLQPNAATPADMESDGLAWLAMTLTDLSALPGVVPPSLRRVTCLLTGAQSYLIGPSQTWNYPVPTRLSGAMVTVGGMDSVVEILDSDAWDRIGDKADGDVARWVRYEPGLVSGVVYVWPVGGGSLTLTYWHDFVPPATGTDAIGLPPRYDLLVVLLLAERLAPIYSRSLPPEAAIALAQSRVRLMAATARRPILDTSVSL